MPLSPPPLTPAQAAAVVAAGLPRLVSPSIPAGNTVTSQTEAAFASKLTIPANAIGLGQGFAIRDTMFGVYTSSGTLPSIIPRVRLGGVSLLPPRSITGLLASANAPWRTSILLLLTDQGIVGSGLLWIDDNQLRIFGQGAPITGINFGIDNDFTGSAQWGQTGCSITLHGRVTEILKAS